MMTRIRYKTKNESAYEDIKLRILRGYHKPGGKLAIQRIAKGLGFSEIPVREALKKLEAEGFVQNNPHSGFVVSEPDFKSKGHIFEIRQLLEGHAIRLAANNISEKSLQKLGQLIDEMRKKLVLNDIVSLSNLNYHFHDTIYASSGNPILYKLIQQTWNMSPRTQAVYTLIKGRVESAIKEHEEIYESLREGNAEKAKEVLFIHKQRSYDLLSGYGKDSEKENE